MLSGAKHRGCRNRVDRRGCAIARIPYREEDPPSHKGQRGYIRFASPSLSSCQSIQFSLSLTRIVKSDLTSNYVGFKLRFWWRRDYIPTIADRIGFRHPHRIDDRRTFSSAC
jgi:hypothetical protein